MRDPQVEANGGGRPEGRRLGLACVGLGGAVATTAVAGIDLIRAGLAGTDGLPLAALDAEGSLVDLAPYEYLVFGGWDVSGDDLASAALSHRVLDGVRLEAVKSALSAMRSWPAVGNKDFCRKHFPNARRRLHWALPDPSGATGTEEDRLEVFRSVRDDLRARIEGELIAVRR